MLCVNAIEGKFGERVQFTQDLEMTGDLKSNTIITHLHHTLVVTVETKNILI